MIQPRGTFTVLNLISQAERKVGQITVPTNKDLFCEAEVLAVGPGSIAAGGGRSDTFDLKVGQRVLVTHKLPGRGEMGGPVLKDSGIPYNDGDQKYVLMEERYILGILAEALPADAGRAGRFTN